MWRRSVPRKRAQRAGRLLRADLPGSERVLLTDRCKTVRHGGVDRRARGAAICAERCRPGRPVQPASGGLHRAVEQIRAELDALVGLAPVKEYVFGLADNLQVQQRRAAAGFKTASLSMHMIFTGNPGTGKTTIARLVAKYLKAIGALKAGSWWR